MRTHKHLATYTARAVHGTIVVDVYQLQALIPLAWPVKPAAMIFAKSDITFARNVICIVYAQKV